MMIDVRLTTSAQTSLSTLRRANEDVNSAAKMTATGREVSNSADSAAIWALGALMESEAVGYSAEAQVLALKQSSLMVDRAKAEGAVQMARDGIAGSVVEATLAGASAAELDAVLTGALSDVEAAVDEAAAHGAQEKALGREAAFKKDLESALAVGISAMMDTDIEKSISEQQQAQLQRDLALKSLAALKETGARSVSMLF
ncbi:MAG: hypothetical protein MRY74_01595 [Neomegalonema sp.]|nr:hypothetical protein [Neomegalonema sp.]